MEEKEKRSKFTPEDAVFSKTLRAGKRTYFFDVKKLFSNEEHFLTITESKKKFNNSNGKFFYEKHKIFLYREDIEGFLENFKEAYAEMEELNKDLPPKERQKYDDQNNSDDSDESSEKSSDNDKKKSFSDVNFEDLGNDKTSE